MNLPFTADEFLGVFENYNLSVFPFQVVLYLLAVAMIFLAYKRFSFSDTVIGYGLAFLWLWTGIVYHILFFSPVNPAAKIFGILFILQGIVFLIFTFRSGLTFSFKPDLRGASGAMFMLYALIIYPVLGALSGHAYPRNPTFGLPCPTTIFTFGILLWSRKKLSWYLVIIPLLWSVIGFSAALKLGIPEDIGLLVAGLTGTLLLLMPWKNAELPEPQ